MTKFLVLLFLLAISIKSYATTDCSQIIAEILRLKSEVSEVSPLDSPRGIAQRREIRQQDKGSKRLTHRDVELDEALYIHMKGEAAPKALEPALPNGVTFIDHELYLSNKPGFVKLDQGGEFISLRAEVPFEGKTLATNIGMSRRALLDNLGRNKKHLVREEAKAVVIFVHGGGTNSTGHHVAANIVNHYSDYGIDVISLDLPWHAEGPRFYFDNSEEIIKWMRNFVSEYALPSDKPIFLAGHSMGGEFANMYMRASRKDDPWFKGIIALSAPVDPKPEITDASAKLDSIAKMWDDIQEVVHEESPESLAELAELEAKFKAQNKAINEIVNTDEGVLDQTTFDGKTSPMGIMFEQVMTLGNTWQIPEHNGDEFLPAFFAWGRYDYLLAGPYQSYVSRYIEPLSNVDVKLYGYRETIEERIEKIGHLIFNHYTLGSDKELEAFADIRKFISEQIGEPIGHLPKRKQNQQLDMFANIVREYAANLGFRAFVDRATLTKRMPKDGKLVGETQKALQANFKKLKDKEITDKVRQEIQDEIGFLTARVKGTFVPTDKSGDQGRIWLSEIEARDREIKSFVKKQQALNKEKERVDREVKSKIAKIEAQKKNLLSVQELEDLQELQVVYEQAQLRLVEALQDVTKAIDDHLKKTLVLGENTSPSAELYEQIRKFEFHEYENLFLSARREYEDELDRLLQSGKLGEDAKVAHQELTKLQDYQATIEEAQEILISYLSKIQKERGELEQRLTETYNADMWSYEVYSFKDIMKMDLNEWTKRSGILQEFMNRWKSIQ